MAKTRRQFSAEFKREAVNLAHCPGISVAQVAKELQVNAGVFRRWMRELETGTWEVEAGKPHRPVVLRELTMIWAYGSISSAGADEAVAWIAPQISSAVRGVLPAGALAVCQCPTAYHHKHGYSLEAHISRAE